MYVKITDMYAATYCIIYVKNFMVYLILLIFPNPQKVSLATQNNSHEFFF